MKTMIKQDDVVYQDGRQTDEQVTARVKHCPQCDALLFEDMDICYGCLHDFSKDANSKDADAYWEDFSGTSEFEEDSGMYCGGDVLPKSCGGVLVEKCRGIDAYDFHDIARDITSDQVNEGISSLEKTTTLALAQDRRVNEPSAVRVRVALGCADVTCSVSESGLAVGRSDDNDIVLHSRTVSRYHLKIFPSISGAVVIDQGATNPACVDGVYLTGSHCLQSGEVVDVCGTRITILSA